MSFKVRDWIPKRVVVRSLVARRRLLRVLGNKFVAGLLILMPIELTVKGLEWQFRFLDGLTHHGLEVARLQHAVGRVAEGLLTGCGHVRRGRLLGDHVATGLGVAELRALEAGTAVRVADGGATYAFQPEDVIVEREVVTDWLVASDGPYVRWTRP